LPSGDHARSLTAPLSAWIR